MEKPSHICAKNNQIFSVKLKISTKFEINNEQILSITYNSFAFLRIKQLLLIVFLLIACCYSIQAQWIQVADFAGGERDDLVAFTCNDRAFAGTGMNSSFSLTKDFYEYMPTSNHWQAIADLPGNVRQYAFSFSFQEVACVFAGTNEFGIGLSDGFLYQPQQNNWYPIAAYPGNASRGCAAAVLDKFGYAGLGRNNNNETQNDWWQYSLDSNVWNQKAPFPGGSRNLSACFESNGFIYVVGGINTQDIALNDIWQYNPLNDTWTSIALLLPEATGSMAACKVKYSGVMIGGYDGQSIYRNAAIVFDGFNNSISNISPISLDGERKGAKAFSLNGDLYLTCGITSGNVRLKSTWKYNQISADKNLTNADIIQIFPNPATDKVELKVPKKLHYKISNYCLQSIHGKVIESGQLDLSADKIILDFSEFQDGLYFLCILGAGFEFTQKLLICR